MGKRTYEEYIKNGCHPVGYNEPCQSYYFGQTSVDLLLDKIDQLKQQLEDEKKLHSLAKAFYDEKQAEFDKLLYDYNKLKQQLAEKDKEIENLKQEINEWVGYKFVKLQYQKAIQELEKVKVNLKDRITMMSNKEHSYLQKVVSWYDICNQVNKQIKELKGGDEYGGT